MPTLVADSAAPTKICAACGLSGRSQAATPHPSAEGRGDTDERHEQRRGPDPDERADVGLEPDVEQQDEDSDLRQDLQGRLGLHIRDGIGAAEEDDQAGEDDADHQLAEHRWLAQALGREPAEVGGEQENAEREEDAGDRPLALTACGERHAGPQGEGEGEQESGPGAHGSVPRLPQP